MIETKILEESQGMEMVSFEMLSVNGIEVDWDYQRHLSLGKVKELSANFDINIAGEIIVSRRGDGKIVVLDGQHRIAAMKNRGIVYARCQVFSGLTRKQEADIYIQRNTGIKAPEALEVFKARLVKEDPIAVAINGIVEKCGLYVQFNYSKSNGRRLPKTIWAVIALEEIYKKGKEKLLEEILTLSMRSWPDDPSAFESKVLLGIYHFHMKYQGRYSRNEFISKMGITDLATLRKRAQYHHEMNHTTAERSFAKSLQEAYDKGRRYRNRLEGGKEE